ncbi:hypothetical protein [Vreelandella azerica]|uniref:hypothetical protein n=1 Tax=Vreelandella azerica TaxID=2732867 RepID=UPI001F2FD617|nr:hypothetical protein [Halomonas azerica]
MAIRINEQRDDQAGVVGPLAKMAVLLLDRGGIDLLEELFIKKAVMVVGQQIKEIAGKQEMLVRFDRAVFERRDIHSDGFDFLKLKAPS